MDLRSRINKTGGSPDGSRLGGSGSAVGSSGGRRYDVPVKERAEMAGA